jgi:hypothetical protein
VFSYLAPTLRGGLLSAQVQDQTPQRPKATPNIDGSVSPHLVPDEVAILMFLRSVAEPKEATAHALKRMRVKLANAGLDSTDIDRAIPIINTFHAGASSADNAISAIYASAQGRPLSGASRNEVGVLRQTLRASASMSYSSLLVVVSKPQTLQSHIQQIKHRMRAYALPVMPNDSGHMHD